MLTPPPPDHGPLAQETDLGPALTLLFCCCLLVVMYLAVAECNQHDERRMDLELQERRERESEPQGAYVKAVNDYVTVGNGL